MKRGQITVFIIIGLIILLVIGIIIYVTRVQVTKEIEAVRPSVAKLPQEIQPVRDLVDVCISRLGKDGLKKLGDQGGYITPLPYTARNPTGGEAAEFSPGAGPVVAYWWYMKSDNKCEQNCQFDTKKPLLRRTEGANSIEEQLDEYISSNLQACLDRFQELQRKGCSVVEEGKAEVATNIAKFDVFFVVKYPLRGTCGKQTFALEDYYVSIPLNFVEIYDLATKITNMEIENRILETATVNVIETFSGIDSENLPPPRDLDVGPPKPGTYWIKYNVLQKLKGLLVAYVPIIQVWNTRNYRYVAAPQGVRDSELYELIYNRQFLVPIEGNYPDLEVTFNYFDWWEPYFDLNCNGQLCQADSGTNFFAVPITINRYTFAYDLSYPVLVEIRNPTSLKGEGYSFKFLLEQNMRNTEAFLTDTPLLKGVQPPGPPSIFCDPAQRTSGQVSLYVRDGLTLKGQDEASVSYICLGESCNLGETDNGEFSLKFPQCIGGTLRLTKPGYATLSVALDTNTKDPVNMTLMMEPIRTLNASVKNYPITKPSKYADWQYVPGGSLRPKDAQSTVIVLTRNGTPYDEPFGAVTEIFGDNPATIDIIPGKYKISLTSFLKDNLTIPPDRRCNDVLKLPDTKCFYLPQDPSKCVPKEEKECYLVPPEAIKFNETSPFPYGSNEFYYEFTPAMLRGAQSIEFKQFILAIDRIAEDQRIIEDLSEATKVNNYAMANEELLSPVIK
ncbi:MAG TPA: hypothetical protein VI612_03265 [Candidatus Nanoarchaeia archaeon]|nr:hypothetical protein [Candidatus Nanoarchaeia archaeon]